MSTSTVTPLALTPPIAHRVRAYFAAPNRAGSQPVIFDPAQSGSFVLNTPPSPWLDLGWVDTFERTAGTKIVPLRSGAPGLPLSQVRTEMDSLVTLHFLSWGKFQMAVTGGSEQMNLLATASGAAANGSGGTAAAAVPVQANSTPTFVAVAPAQLSVFTPGQMVVVDVNYTGQTGYVGSGVSGAYVSSAAAVNNDANYIRRVSFNVGRITSVGATGLNLAQPLMAGTPTTSMFVQPIAGFVDREGSNFFQEWSALFVIPGEQGDRVLLHYPRLQIAASVTELQQPLAAPLAKVDTFARVAQVAQFRALPVTDTNDGAQVLCFRSYIPAAATNLW
jgi:3D (Asp-Asp-Asp) domain-containing protein